MNAQVHRELWTSWASLLRAYTGAHGLNSTYHAVVEVGSDEIVLRVDIRWLRFTHDAVTDLAGRTTRFSLNQDGTVTLGEAAPEEMDMAAERFAREMLLSA